MLYHVIEKNPANSKTKVIKKTNDYNLATNMIEENSNYFIHYDKAALDKINAPVVKKTREMSPIETFHVRKWANTSNTEEKRGYYEIGTENG